MSRRAGPGRAWPLAAWLFFVVVIIGAGFGVLAGILSPVVVLDVISFWPGAIPGLLAVPAAFALRRARPRVMAIPALLLLTWLTLAIAAHLSAWELLPSSSVDLVGPATPPVTASLTVDLGSGRLEVYPDAGAPSYAVTVMRSGGDAGVPEAIERASGDALDIVLENRRDSDWFRFAGWEVGLAPSARWDLSITSDSLDADLRSLPVSSLTLHGIGSLRLDMPDGETTVSADGAYEIDVPAVAPGRVVGRATVPADWERTEDGWISPFGAEGWVFVVEPGATLTVRSRG